MTKLKNKKQVEEFIQNYKDSEKSTVIRLLAYFEDNGKTINNIAEFHIWENDYSIGVFTKTFQIRAHVKNIVDDFFKTCEWIEIEKTDYQEF